MILSDRDILAEIANEKIKIHDFNPRLLGPNSYDVRLGNFFYSVVWEIDTPQYYGPIMVDDGKHICIKNGCTLLGMTKDVIGTTGNIVASLRGRSTTRRMGITICDDAGVGDVGYYNHWTCELTGHIKSGLPSLVVGDTFGQIIFYRTESEPLHPYSGQYNSIDWPECMVPKAYRDSIKPWKDQ